MLNVIKYSFYVIKEYEDKIKKDASLMTNVSNDTSARTSKNGSSVTASSNSIVEDNDQKVNKESKTDIRFSISTEEDKTVHE